jgi:ubiquinone/menaquinone biosynthesis C-methylase UbiE
VFDNLINVDDARLVWDKVKGGQLRRVWDRLVGGGRRRTQLAWEKTATPPDNWWDIPAVQRRRNELISGDPEVGFNEYVCRRYLAARQDLYGLSLGCGTGVRELGWAASGKFGRLEAYDLSPQRIAYAQQSAVDSGQDEVLYFRVGDAYQIDLCAQAYDVVLAEGSLHHFSPLRQILVRIEACLQEDGLLVADEFIGPNQFQWSARQLEVINGLLAVLPARYRTLWQSAATKRPVFRPSRLLVRLGDPSEAVEAAAIMPLLHEIFEVVEVKPYGGAVLHMLFHTIGHHFLDDSEETRRLLQLCFAAEDALMASGDLVSDFAVVVCRKKGSKQ